MTRIRAAVLAALALGTVVAAPAAFADDQWIVRAGITNVDPKSRNLALNATTDVTIDSKLGFTFDVTYKLAPNWGVELLAAYPFEHDIDLRVNGARSALGSVKHLPPTLSLQYHANPDGRFRPYVGVGLNYTLVLSEEPDALELDDSFGLALGGGFDVTLGERALLNFALRYIDIDVDAKLGGANIGTVEVDPLVYSVNFGWRF